MISSAKSLRVEKPLGVARATQLQEIEDRRTELADFLTGKGWRVLPERNVCDSDIERCGATTKAFCKDAAAFIQLLSRFPWRPSELDRIQFQAALDFAEDGRIQETVLPLS